MPAPKPDIVAAGLAARNAASQFFEEESKSLQKLAALDPGPILKSINAMPKVDFGPILKTIDAMPKVDFGPILNAVNAMPKTDFGPILKTIDAMPRADFAPILQSIDGMPKVDLGLILNTIDAMPKVDFGPMLQAIVAMPKVDVGPILNALDTMPRVELGVILNQLDFGYRYAEPVLAGAPTSAAATFDEEQLLARAWVWWLALTPAQRRVQNSFVGAVFAACYLVHVLMPNRNAEIILGTAAFLLALLALLNAIEDAKT